MPKIFISYRREDSKHVTGRLYDQLEPHFGPANVFFDVDTIPPGVDFRVHLDHAVGQCNILLAIIGEQWLDARYQQGSRKGQRRLDDPGDFVRIEIQSALARGIPVIPVLIDGTRMPVEQLPKELCDLAYRNAAEVRSGRDFRDHVDRLIRDIEYLLGGSLPREMTNSIGMKLVCIPAGKFKMGSTEAERNEVFALLTEKSMPDWLKAEGPQHEVEITRAFYLGIHQVTQKQFRAVMGYNPSYFSNNAKGKAGIAYAYGQPGGGMENVKGLNTDDFPVENVSWEESDEFCRELTKAGNKLPSGWLYHLPSEAQWEYACRGGAHSYQTFNVGKSLSSAQANLGGNHPYDGPAKEKYLERTCAVGNYKANTFGLFDMHGNVREWCADWYDAKYYGKSPLTDPRGPAEGSARVTRGGCWYFAGRGCRSASRSECSPGGSAFDTGFRVALVVSEQG